MKANLAVDKKPAGAWLKSFSKTTPATKMTLVCFPFAGGGANIYRQWPTLMDSSVEVMAVALPGREARISEKNIGDVDVVCNAIVNELVTHHWQKPLAFFGHSMGSMLAYEVAVRLQENYQWVPKVIFASGRQAPHKKMGGEFHLAPEAKFIEELKRLNGTPSSIFDDDEMRNIVVSILRADYRLLETYRMQFKIALRAPIVTCCGDRDTEVALEEMQAWAELSAVACSHHVFDGGHFYLSDQAKQLTEVINAQLQRSCAFL